MTRKGPKLGKPATLCVLVGLASSIVVGQVGCRQALGIHDLEVEPDDDAGDGSAKGDGDDGGSASGVVHPDAASD